MSCEEGEGKWGTCLISLIWKKFEKNPPKHVERRSNQADDDDTGREQGQSQKKKKGKDDEKEHVFVCDGVGDGVRDGVCTRAASFGACGEGG
ncbi:MAG TPA: hypothetical protein DCE42_20970 [Myxococcales bacterium]|nr:hypothetical protein [Deltaproteobacteria bacterium]MBU48152.1 hypothetical protein [Deltaproteobacteria bacterium]HAA57252.1 hypothetical protein [Myxococcales bacterium]